jgi:hypothetical protein
MFLSTVYTISERSAVNFAGKVRIILIILFIIMMSVVIVLPLLIFLVSYNMITTVIDDCHYSTANVNEDAVVSTFVQ